MTTRLAVVSCLAVASLFSATTAARAGDFDRLVRRIESRHAIQSEELPGGWLTRAIVGIVKPEGVLDVRLARLSGANAERLAGRDDLAQTIRESLGSEWRRIVHTRSRRDGTVSIYARAREGKYSLVIVSLAADEGEILEVSLQPERFLRWMIDPLNSARRSPA